MTGGRRQQRKRNSGKSIGGPPDRQPASAKPVVVRQRAFAARLDKRSPDAVVYTFFSGNRQGEAVMPSRDYLYPALLFEGGLGLSAALVGWLCGHPPWESLHWTPDGALTGAAATVPMLLGLLWIVQSRLRPVARLTEAVTALAAQLFAGASWLELLLVAAVAGFGEELLFRGLIQAWVEATRGPAVGLLVASLLFGLAHPISLTYAVLAAGIGFYLGWLWLYSGNLLVPIVTHALYDFVALIYLLHKHPRSAPPATDKMPR